MCASKQIQFDLSKCMVVYNTQKPPKGDNYLRRLVCGAKKSAVVERIIRSGDKAPKYISQFQRLGTLKTEMFQP